MLYIPDDYNESTATTTQIRIGEKEFDIHVNKKDRLNTSTRKLFSIIMGKFTEYLKAKLQGILTFKAIEDYNGAIGYIRAKK